MTEITDIEAEPKSPTEAFEDLRREVAFMRRAIERMADDQRAAPDYSETLGKMADNLTTASKSLGWLTQRPIVKTTVEQMAREICEAGDFARVADQRMIESAARILNDTNQELFGLIATARNADDQQREVLRFRVISVGAGAVVAIILTIACFKLFPEHGAAWLLGKDRWQAGQQLMASADPDRWAELEPFASLDRNNNRAIVVGENNAKRSGQDPLRRVKLRGSSKLEK